MRIRKALIAASISALLTVLILYVCLSFSRHTLNQSALSDLDRISALLAIHIEHGHIEEDPGAYFDRVSQGAQIYSRLISQDGEVVFDNLPENSRAQTLRTVSSSGVMAGGGIYPTHWKDEAYVVKRMPEGELLAVSMFNDWGSSLFGRMRFAIALLLLAVLATAFFGAMLLISTVYGVLAQIQGALNDFAAGDFGARVTEMPEDTKRLINRQLERIQLYMERERAKTQTLATVVHSAQTGILSVDNEMNLTLATTRAKQLLGIIGAPEGHHLDDVLPDVHLEPMLREAMGQEGVYTNEIATRTAEGRQKRPLRLYITRMQKSYGEVIGAVAFIEDITELRRLEQVRTDFVANVSHELKTPLTSIKGFVETLQDGAIHQPELAGKFLRIIMMEAERLTRLINDILSISKLESGEDQVSMQVVRLDKIASDVVDMLRMNAAERKIEIYITENSGPVLIWANLDRVDQMLINLVDNAVKYTPDGGSVTVGVYHSQGQAYLSVSDTGIGIPEEHIPRLFERFYRVDKGRSRSMGGTGLGLAIVKHIVNSMNGTIEVHSKVKKGTEFLITLPLCPKERLTGTPDTIADGLGWDDD